MLGSWASHRNPNYGIAVSFSLVVVAVSSTVACSPASLLCSTVGRTIMEFGESGGIRNLRQTSMRRRAWQLPELVTLSPTLAIRPSMRLNGMVHTSCQQEQETYVLVGL